MKFGGTSVATAEARNQSALRVVSAREQGYTPVVVVSAIGRKGAPYATDTLVQVVREIDPNVEPDARELDLILACGEILSAVVFAHTLKVFGHPAQAFRGGQAGIRTDGVFGNARIMGINPVALVRSIQQGYIPVVCGFQGVYIGPEGNPGAELTTLGRGGSDTTAAALGAALQAECVEIYTDVDGVKTADPDAVPSAPTLRRVTYDEVAEIAHLGAKVVHPRAAEIAMHFSIPLWVKNTFSDDTGTLIVDRAQAGDRRLTGVTHSGQLVYLQFDLSRLDAQARLVFESEIYGMLAQNDVHLYMVNINPDSAGFAVTRSQYPLVEDLFDALVLPIQTATGTEIHLIQLGVTPSQSLRIQQSLLKHVGPVRVVSAARTEGCTMVSLVGDQTMKEPGLFAKVLATLAAGQVPVLQTADSDFSLSVLVPESDCNRAVRLLHEEFDLAGLN